MNEARPRVSSGIKGLDDILQGGLPGGTTTLIQGEPGTGKTTLALQYMIAGAKRGEKALFISLSQTRDELNAIAASHGMDLTGIAIESLDTFEEPEEASFSIDTNESMLVSLSKHIYACIEREDPQLFVFDSLLELRLLSPDAMVYRSEVLALRRYLANRRITALFLDHIDQPYIDRQVEGIVHGAITLRADAPPIGIIHRRLSVTKLRGCSFREGFHDFRILPGGVQVYPRIVPALSPDVSVTDQLSTEQETLDRMLGGGLEYGTTVLIAGQAGTGKSTLSTLFAVASAKSGTKAAIYLFEERPEVYRERSNSVGLAMSAHEESGMLQMQHFDPAEISPGEFCQTVVDDVEKHGIRLVVIDSLTGYLNALPHRENVQTHLHTLLQYLSRSGVLVVVTMAQHGLLGEPPRSEMDTSYLADSIILLRHYAAASEIRRSIAVLKKRHSAHERKIQEFIIRSGSVGVTELSDEAAQKQRGSDLVGGP